MAGIRAIRFRAWPDSPNPTGLAPDTARLRRLPAPRKFRSVPNGINGEVRERIMKAWGSDTVRGGQTVFHGLRMWSQLVTVGVMTIAILVVTVPVFMLWRTTPTYDGYAAGMLTLAETKLSIGYDADAGQEVRLENGDTVVATIADIAAFGPWHAARDGILETVISGAWLGAKIGAGLVALMLGWFRYQGYRLKQKKRLRGAELVSARELSRRVHPLKVRALHRLAGAPAPYRIAGVPYPERTETQHTIVSGTTGSGKTVLISDLVQQIRQRGDRCVIYDKMGSYTQAFFDPERDVLLNPLDARAPRWSPFFEARSPRDFDTMAAALIPQQKDTVDPFWVTAARQLFSNGAGVLWEKGVKQNAVLVEHLLKTDLTELAKAMEGTVAQSIVDPENPKTALSVRAMLTANIGAMEILPDAGKPFSIREWTSRNEENSFLFLTSRGDQHATLRGLISTWLEIAVNALLSLDRDDDRRIWVILDELPTLHQVPSLQPGLAESRQFGAASCSASRSPRRSGSLRAKRRRDHLRALRHARRVRRTRPRHRAVVGRQPRAKRDRGSRRGRELWRGPVPRRRHAHAAAGVAVARAAVGNHPAAEPHGVSETPRPLPGRPNRTRLREAPEDRAPVRAANTRARHPPGRIGVGVARPERGRAGCIGTGVAGAEQGHARRIGAGASGRETGRASRAGAGKSHDKRVNGFSRGVECAGRIRVPWRGHRERCRR